MGYSILWKVLQLFHLKAGLYSLYWNLSAGTLNMFLLILIVHGKERNFFFIHCTIRSKRLLKLMQISIVSNLLGKANLDLVIQNISLDLTFPEDQSLYQQADNSFVRI